MGPEESTFGPESGLIVTSWDTLSLAHDDPLVCTHGSACVFCVLHKHACARHNVTLFSNGIEIGSSLRIR